jgi:hypothetical protein
MPFMPALYIANAILFFHALFVSVVVFSVPLIAIGGWRGWRWVRNPWFRFIHLGMIGFVAMEALIGMECPLTTWESDLRNSIGQAGYDREGFIAQGLSHVMFYAFPHWVFTAIYVGFGLLVASLFYLVPVRRAQEPPNQL